MWSILCPIKILSSSQFMGSINFWYFYTYSINVGMKWVKAQSNKSFFSDPQQFVTLQVSWKYNLRSHSRHLLKLFVCNSLPDLVKNNCHLTCSSFLKFPRKAPSLLGKFFEPTSAVWSQATIRRQFISPLENIAVIFHEFVFKVSYYIK